jgi:hypothetical protein
MKHKTLKLNIMALTFLISAGAVAQMSTSPKNDSGAVSVPKYTYKGSKTKQTLKSEFTPTLEMLKQKAGAEKTQMGGVNGGGGNVIRSTPAEVKEYLQTVQYVDAYPSTTVKGLMFDMLNAVSEIEMVKKNFEALPLPPRVKEIFSKMSLQRWQISYSVNPSPLDVSPASRVQKVNLADYKLDLKSDEPCLHLGEARDASYDADTGKICLSLPRLTGYPSNVFANIIVPLIFHEMAHEAGYGEEDAKLVQNYLTEKMSSTTCRFEVFPQSSIGKGGRLNVEFKNSNFLKFSMEDWSVRDSINGFYGWVSNHWQVSRSISQVYMQTPDGKKVQPGDLHGDPLSVKWNSDYSGELMFQALDVADSPKVVTDRIVWSRPRKASGLEMMYGGFVADVLPGTSLTIKGKVYTTQNSKFSMKLLGRCF